MANMDKMLYIYNKYIDINNNTTNIYSSIIIIILCILVILYSI